MTASIMSQFANFTIKIKKIFNETAVKFQREYKNNFNEIIGPMVKTFDFGEGTFRKFKGGLRRFVKQVLCKNRYQQVSITPLGDIANSSRILQTAPAPTTYNMTIQLSTSDVESSAIKMAMSAFALLCMTLAFVF